jgi:dethiobiotin synthetase
MRGLFVTGTDTDVGKSVLSAVLVAALSTAGEPVSAYKPVVTGLDEPPDEHWPRDHELLAAAGGGRQSAEEVSPLRFGPAVSPHLAAELAGTTIEPDRLIAHARELADGSTDAAQNEGKAATPRTLVVEGVGGLLVPLAEDYAVADLAVALALPLIVAARAGLGTINHTLLTLEAARQRGLDVRAVVLMPWPAQPSSLEHSNKDTIERVGSVEVATLPMIDGPELTSLARVGAALPWQRWLDG